MVSFVGSLSAASTYAGDHLIRNTCVALGSNDCKAAIGPTKLD